MKLTNAQYSNTLLLSVFSQVVMANELITFKSSFSPKHAGLSYAFALLLLFMLLFIIKKKYKPSLTQPSTCRVIEKKYLGNKTTIYILDYQEQRFLLADNQQALALQPLVKKELDE